MVCRDLTPHRVDKPEGMSDTHKRTGESGKESPPSWPVSGVEAGKQGVVRKPKCRPWDGACGSLQALPVVAVH